MESQFPLSRIQPDQLQAAGAGEIDKVISQMFAQSRDNYAQIEALALECSSALSSAEAKSNGLSEQSLFKRLWNGLTGKNERLRTAIEQDRAAAQYAMQQAITNVLQECTQNRLLALAVKSTLEGKMTDPELAAGLQELAIAEDGDADGCYTPEEMAGESLSAEPVLELAGAELDLEEA